jgi:hypothetical protein
MRFQITAEISKAEARLVARERKIRASSRLAPKIWLG